VKCLIIGKTLKGRKISNSESFGRKIRFKIESVSFETVIKHPV